MNEEIGEVKINGHVYRKPVIKVAAITHDGATCIVPVGDLIDMLDDGGEYMVQIKTMSKAKFDRLDEFAGW